MRDAHLRGGADMMAVIGIAGLPLALLGMLMRTLTEWPGELIWLIAGICVPLRFRNGFLGAAAVAAFGFFFAWAAEAVNGWTHGISADEIARTALTFALGLAAFAAGQALRHLWKRRA